MKTTGELALKVLETAGAQEKAALSRKMAALWRDGNIAIEPAANIPERPMRPNFPELRRPGDMPKRGFKGPRGRIALLHALADIELNAIDLAWNLVARFGVQSLPRGFFEDWITVGDDEARHFLLLDQRLADLGTHYGSLPAHDGLWQAASDTADDFAARLAVVPMVLEARGLDVTPAMISRLERGGYTSSAAILQIIYEDEIEHVAAGTRWFNFVAASRGKDLATYWQNLVAVYFKGNLKPPFNHSARQQAGFSREYYAPSSSNETRASNMSKP